jgi:nucleoside-diphosphate-sugar epimerase
LRVLVSGAGGFVGRHLAVAMARDGHDVLGLVRKARPAILEQDASIRIQYADLAAEADALPASHIDAVFHCAAAIPSAVSNQTDLMSMNVQSSRRLFEYAAKSGAGIIVFCSSMAVYGLIDVDVVDRDTPINYPGAYGRSKLESERNLAELSDAHAGLRALSIRLPGVVGPGSHDNFLSDTMSVLAAGGTADVRNPHSLFNNVVHIDDLIHFAATLLRTLPPGHDVTTVAALDPLPIREVVGLMQRAAGPGAAIRFRSEGRSFLISNEHAQTLGYRPTTVREAVLRYALGYSAEHKHAAVTNPKKSLASQ